MRVRVWLSEYVAWLSHILRKVTLVLLSLRVSSVVLDVQVHCGKVQWVLFYCKLISCFCLSLLQFSAFFSSFPIVWGRRNGIACHSSTVSCSVCPPRFNTSPSTYILHESLHLIFCIPLRLFPGTGAYNILLNTCPSSLLLTYP